MYLIGLGANFTNDQQQFVALQCGRGKQPGLLARHVYVDFAIWLAPSYGNTIARRRRIKSALPCSPQRKAECVILGVRGNFNSVANADLFGLLPGLRSVFSSEKNREGNTFVVRTSLPPKRVLRRAHAV